ncbi:MAG TPA: hypothetical protein DEP48_00235 [Persephonella sp.]|uniref:Uncharacterized protein n=1 Tax=Persephonella marina (strain DSM 14350 / EX-H1) TaxID=123214 RepID=C0QQR9_PERMH|nr:MULTISPECIES: hypothetical protein [Persephonella]ACO03014.1 hypothetical protein PERMA_1242 [Persephonella marina EX-H1]HCB68765.1 hypothetical protein [Persephonella sp.]
MERLMPTVFLKAYELIDENTMDKLPDVETPLVLVEMVEDFKENTFWVKIRNVWTLIGKIPPLVPSEGDIVLFREKGQWGLFKYLGEEEDRVVLRDGRDERTTRVPKDVIESLELFGKVIRVQEKV